MKLNISLAGALLCFLCTQTISAQDIHLSQYHFDRLQINPALTGIFNGNRQVALLHKQQYFSVDGVDYLTFSGSYDTKFLKTLSQKGFFSAGVLFNYDEAGKSELSYGSLSINGSYTRALTKSLYVGAGVYVGGGQRSFKENGLLFDNNWVGGQLCATCPTNENFDRTNFFFLDVGAGLNLRLQGRDRTKIDLGVGSFHLNQPGFSFYDADDITLPIRLAFYGTGILKLASRIDLYGNGMIQQQGPYEETVVGGGIILHLSTKRAREVELHLGVATRLEDAIIPMIALGYDGWKGGFSYDVNTSHFKNATNKKGGPEFFLTYTWKKLYPLEQTRVCSIF